jgi:CubicO group peptidase (beta-lactamase class C family)
MIEKAMKTRPISIVRLAIVLVLGITLALLASGWSSSALQTSRAAAGAHAGSAAGAYLDALVWSRQFSGAVLLAERGRVILSGGYGWANLATGVPNTPATRFRIGSLTKAFTAMAVLELTNAGRLRLTDRVCSFITGCPPAWGQITLQELLTHTSGIPDYTTVSAFGRFSQRHLTPAELVALVRGQPLLFLPGTRWSYSNTGYALLGMVIERVSGEPYATFLERHVLAPLGLRGTGYDTNNPSLPAHATGYAGWGSRASSIDMSVPYAAGALDSTVGDLYRWDLALLSGHPQLVRPDVLDQMFRPWVLIDSTAPKSGAYGFGWFIDNRGAEYDHDGDINGFVSYNAIFPRARVEVIVLSNLESGDVRSIAEHLAGLMHIHAA